MKFMEKAKRFFTLSAKHEGFTLVELIVVIAILAILAGVAVPAYSGYINKSKEAADSNLLNAVNKAFAAACSANASDVYLVNNAAITLEGGYVKNVTIPAEYDEAFQMFFEGNSNAKFETIEALYFDPTLHQFVDAAKGGAYAGLLNNIMQNNKPWVSALNGSIFMDSDAGLGTEGLLDKVNKVTNFAAEIDSEALNKVLSDEGFQTFAAGILGTSNQKEYEEKFADLTKQMMAKNPDWTKEQAESQLRANAVVLYAANNTSSMTTDSVKALLGSGNGQANIMASLNTNPGQAMSEAAVAYGMYTAYAYSTGQEDLIKGTENPLTTLTKLNDPDFLKYINDDKNAADIEGYLAAMNIVGSSTGDTGAVDQLMVNGFADPSLSAVLNQLGSAK